MADLLPINQPQSLHRAQTISAREVVYILFRRRWVILCIAAPIMLAAALGVLRQGGSTTAAARVLLELRSPETPQWNLSTPIDLDRTISTYQHMAMSVPVAHRAAEMLADSLDVIRLQHKNYTHLQRGEPLAGFLLGGLDVSVVGESSILDIRFSSVSPRVALMGDRACRDAFLEYSISATRNSRAVEYYDEQVQREHAVIDSLLFLRSKILRQSGFMSIQDDMRFNSGLITEMQKQALETASQRQLLEGRIANFREQFQKDPNFVPLAEWGGNARAIMDAKYRVDEQQDKLNQLMTTFAPNSVEIRRQRDLLENTRTILANSIDSFIKSYEGEVAALGQKESSIQRQLDGLRAAQEAAPEVYSQISMIDTDIQSHREVLEALQVKSGEVRMNEMADERVSRIIKLTEPKIERAVSSSKKFAYFGLVAFFGLLFSLIVAFLIDQQDHRMYTRRDVEEYLDIPVLGTITSEQVRHR